MTNGFLLVNKPSGWTSFDVVAHIRNMLKEKKVGHGGTLDPLGKGLLLIAVGRGTKFLQYIKGYEKTYLCTLYLGEKRDTDDAEGKIVFSSDIKGISEEEIRKVFDNYKGTFLQKVPRYSAVKMKGKRLYQRARKGERFVLPQKEVTVKESEILKIDFPYVTFRMAVSTGTYIRAIARDIGDDLKCGAYLYSLLREKIGPFEISQSVELKELSAKNIKEYIRPINEMFVNFPAVEIGDDILKKGDDISVPNLSDRYYVIKQNGMREAIGKSEKGILKVEKLFNENNI